MRELLYMIIDLFTRFSNLFRRISTKLNLDMSDKQLHFIIIGLLCLGIFLIIQVVFKRLAAWKISSISFIYTFTIGIVIAFAIEIGQWKSGSGSMEFADIVYGLYGFIVFFVAYQMVMAFYKNLKDKQIEAAKKL